MLIDAYMNHGRWVADCPAEGCGFSALAGSHLDCPAHDVVRVVWPTDLEREEIEAELNLRPVDPLVGAKHANWRPGETVESLRAENVEHGVGV